MTNQPPYLAYMLRLWQVKPGGQSVWRASLESPHTGERHNFATIEQLLAFLRDKTRISPADYEPPGETNEKDDTRKDSSCGKGSA